MWVYHLLEIKEGRNVKTIACGKQTAPDSVFSILYANLMIYYSSFNKHESGYKIRKIYHCTFESLTSPEGLKLSRPGFGGCFRPPEANGFQLIGK